MRSHYWTCSKFADWIRGTSKLSMGTAEEWDNWHVTAKMRHNFRYWLAEEGLDYLQTLVYYVPDKIYALKYYINNRYVTRSHQLTAHARDIRPGDWCDVGNRFLPCLFNELVDFVEIELAWSHIVWTDENVDKYNAPFWARGWFRWRTWRCKQAGLDHLAWEMTLKYNEDWIDKNDPKFGQLTPQAISAKEKLDLYTWWTVTRPARPDPYDASGWTAYCELKRLEQDSNSVMAFMKETKNPKLKKAGDLALKQLHKIEAQYEKEDEAMMIRLIKVRHGLWT